jgi:hypothetical protein
LVECRDASLNVEQGRDYEEPDHCQHEIKEFRNRRKDAETDLDISQMEIDS